MTTIYLDYLGALAAGDMRKGSDIMASLGIKYERSEGHPVHDGCKFFGCTDIPSNLPSYVTVR
jgi:hypothetical protein